MADYDLFPFYGYDVNASAGTTRGRPVPKQPGLNVIDTNQGPGYQVDPTAPDLYINAGDYGTKVLTNPDDITAARADARTRGQQAIAKQIAMGLGSAALANSAWSTGGAAAPAAASGTADLSAAVPELSTVGGEAAGVPTEALSAPSTGASEAGWFSKISNLIPKGGIGGGDGSSRAPAYGDYSRIADQLSRAQVDAQRRQVLAQAQQQGTSLQDMKRRRIAAVMGAGTPQVQA